MARKKKVDLSAFDGVLSDLGYGNVMSQEETSDVTHMLDNDIEHIDDEDITSTVTTQTEDDVNNGPHDDNTEIPDDILNNTSEENLNDNNSAEQNDDTVDIDENESAQVEAFFDAFAEELGWDVDDDDKPRTVGDIVSYMGEVIKENSTPQYADERIAKLDEYVKNGGRFEDFYQRQQENISYEDMDMEDESNQKAAVRELYRLQGYSDDQINRRIERFEDADMLEEEAIDAVDRLKTIKAQQLAEYEEQQRIARQAQEEQAAQFMRDLTDNVSNLESIRGIAIPKADRKELFDYITKVDADGLTKYQKDFNNNLVTNLIESAYFTMKGDTLLGEATRSGRTSAANKLRNMLRHQTKNHSRYNVNENKQRSVVDLASQFYS